jgi:hypothetical protein
MNAFIAIATLLIYPVDESKLALHYAPCRELYDKAKREADPVLMHRVVKLCEMQSTDSEL